MSFHNPKKKPKAANFWIKPKEKSEYLPNVERLSTTKVYRGVKNSFKNKLYQKYQTPKVSKQHTVGKMCLAAEV